MNQTIVTFIVPVDPAKRGTLDQILDSFGPKYEPNPLLPFRNMERLHFASLTIFEDEYNKKPPYLIFEINADGDLSSFLDQFWNLASEGLQTVFSCCVGYPQSGNQSDVLAYLLANRKSPSAWHIGNVGRSVKRIHDEFNLRVAIQKHIDELISQPKKFSEKELYNSIRDFVKNDPNLRWALKDAPEQTPWEKVVPKLKIWGLLAVAIVVALRFWKVAIPGAALVVALLRWHETRDDAQAARNEPRHFDVAKVRELEKHEDFIGQNHLASLIRVKPGAFRRALLWFVLFAVNLVARTQTKGNLGGIPSIHFAHWSLVDNGERLLFLSNFDNSWNSYLDDFTDKASTGLTGVWSNTRWFPHTRFLVKEGASDGAAFKVWARGAQSPTRVWYSAYPNLSVYNIQLNSQVRAGLSSDLHGAALTQWLRLF